MWDCRFMSMLAGVVPIESVMDRLRLVRPVFHSEADLQHAFAQVLHDLNSAISVRLEVRQGGREYADLLCFGADGRTLVEFKHFTAPWRGCDPNSGEEFHLSGHAADDLARRGFVFDIARLERFCRGSVAAMNGLAIMLTNDVRLWSRPRTPRLTRDQEFRIHEDRILTGTLRWGDSRRGYYQRNERDLAGRYPINWHPYSNLDGRNGEFRWLAAEIAARTTEQPESTTNGS
jgi:hypothetical protein